MLVLTLTLCVASLGGGLALLGQTERLIASAHLRAIQTSYAADAAARLAVSAVSGAPASVRWPSTGDVPSLTGGARAMAVAPGEVVDLDARTAELNQAAARDWPLGANTPRWRLMGWGRLPTLPAEAAQTAPRVAVWIADDILDRDQVPGDDGNGVMMIRAEAFGPGGAARSLVVHVRREPGQVRVLSWRTGS
jgi:hypothetical protein